MEDEDEPQVLLIALRRIAEARGGIVQVARKASVERESLHRALSGVRDTLGDIQLTYAGRFSQ